MFVYSLDAGATVIQIVVKNGGLKMLQIQDNGSGIAVSFCYILCPGQPIGGRATGAFCPGPHTYREETTLYEVCNF